FADSGAMKGGGLDGLSVGPDGDLVITDLSGRLRRIFGMRTAPLSFGPLSPRLPGAGRGFTPVSSLAVGGAGGSRGVRQPGPVVDGRASYLVAEHGAGRGCVVWRMALARRARRADTADYLGTPL